MNYKNVSEMSPHLFLSYGQFTVKPGDIVEAMVSMDEAILNRHSFRGKEYEKKCKNCPTISADIFKTFIETDEEATIKPGSKQRIATRSTSGCGPCAKKREMLKQKNAKGS